MCSVTGRLFLNLAAIFRPRLSIKDVQLHSATNKSPANSPAKSPTKSRTKGLCILGSTGSIGTQTLEVLRSNGDRFHVESLSAFANADLLIAQALEFKPKRVAIADESQFSHVHASLAPTGIEVLGGKESLVELASNPELDVVIAAIVGFAGLPPTIAALRAGHRVGLANKETLVVAGKQVMLEAARHGGEIIPVDSEHSAIFQCLQGEDLSGVKGLVLTASGGPFRDRPIGTFEKITRSEALAHPNWDMGAKISIDSATMMNKGLEVIEARWLFDVGADDIDVLIHPQSIIHSMVNFVDGSTKAQLGVPDMKVPIQYALSHPERFEGDTPLVDWTSYPALTFAAPSIDRFPCLGLAYDCLRKGGSAPASLNAANEAAVEQFLHEKMSFTGIAKAVDYAVSHATHIHEPTMEDLVAIDEEARKMILEQGSSGRI